MRGQSKIYLLAAVFAAASFSASAAPPPSEAAAVKHVVSWVLTLNSFKGAVVTNKDSLVGKLMIAETEIRSSDGRLVLAILDDGKLFADLNARPPWSDEDTILLRAIAKHLTGDPGEPITPEMALSAVHDDLPVQYLTNGKLEFGYDKASFNLCPWTGDCYSVGIWVAPP